MKMGTETKEIASVVVDWNRERKVIYIVHDYVDTLGDYDTLKEARKILKENGSATSIERITTEVTTLVFASIIQIKK